MPRRLFTLFAFMALAALAQAPGLAQPSMEKEPAIGGYCPVAYVAAGKALKGDRRYSSDHQGRRYLFVSGDAKKMFDENPEKFTIAYDSWCATALAHGKKVASDPKLFSVHNGVTYLFSTRDAKATFDGDKTGHIDKADANWKKMM